MEKYLDRTLTMFYGSAGFCLIQHSFNAKEFYTTIAYMMLSLAMFILSAIKIDSFYHQKTTKGN